MRSSSTPVGQLALHQSLGLRIGQPHVRSFAAPGARRTTELPSHTEEYYPAHYAPENSLLGNLRFALKYEALDLGVTYATLQAIGRSGLEEWVRAEPTGGFSRRAWFLYETLAGETLDLEPVRAGNYINALSEKRHFAGPPRNSSRQRVRDNLLGTGLLCPTLRRTPRLEAMIRADISQQARDLTAGYPPEILARAVRYLYTKETRSSFAIEGEAPGSRREERFLQALRRVGRFDWGYPGELARLQQSIVEPRYASDGWRSSQSYVGETTRGYGQQVHFICPRPQDVPTLMEGWMALATRLLASDVDPVLAAAVIGFSFVFVHPFEDGNGRLHRLLIHDVLAKQGFSPPGLLFPVSAAILRNRLLYDQALEAFSQAILPAIEWRMNPDGEIAIENDTLDLYRFFDATPQAEYLYDRVAETIQVDLKQELDFLEKFDAAYRAVTAVVDMPNKRATLLVSLCFQNQGRLSKQKRKQFPELQDDEIRHMESAIQELLGASEVESREIEP